MQTKNSRKDNQLSRDQLIEEYLPHVKRIVHRIAIHLPPHVEIDDLIHVGVIGLMQADRLLPTSARQLYRPL